MAQFVQDDPLGLFPPPLQLEIAYVSTEEGEVVPCVLLADLVGALLEAARTASDSAMKQLADLLAPRDEWRQSERRADQFLGASAALMELAVHLLADALSGDESNDGDEPA